MSNASLYDQLLAACSRRAPAAALRIRAAYEPTGGPGARVFPPTYPDVRYLGEERYVDGELHAAVALDSVPSQANRVEVALLDAAEAGEVRIPYIEVSETFDETTFRVTSLDAPHRSPDAYFRDSVTDDGTAFDASPLGKRLRTATDRNARAFFEQVPTDLVLGVWDSQRGGRGLRLPRAYTSEIVAYDPKEGVRAAGRLDPYNLQGGEVFYDETDKGNWSFDKTDVTGAGKPKSGKPSNVLHGNALSDHTKTPGGMFVTGIERTAVVSLGVLRRLRFPDADGVANPDVDAAGRAVLAALALVGDRLAFGEASLFLRSGCDLVMTNEVVEWVSAGATTQPFELDADAAIELYEVAVEQSASIGLCLADEVVQLRPAENLRKLVELNLASPVQED